MKKLIFPVILITLILFFSSCTEKNKQNDSKKNIQDTSKQKIQAVESEDVIKPPNLPPLGKWMYNSDKKYSEWLGENLNGKSLREPINLVLVDSISKSAEDAKTFLINNFKLAGFDVRAGHSSGYFGFIENTQYPQLPDKPNHAFSDEPFEKDNNHGRVFGPCVINGVYYFTAAFSREKVVVNIPIHKFESFVAARNKIAENLNAESKYKVAGKVDMQNRLETDKITTGDHDGRAILLSAVK